MSKLNALCLFDVPRAHRPWPRVSHRRNGELHLEFNNEDDGYIIPDDPAGALRLVHHLAAKVRIGNLPVTHQLIADAVYRICDARGWWYGDSKQEASR